MAKRIKYDVWATNDNLLRVEAWARDGLTDTDIANNIGISRTTLWKWKKQYPEFEKALAHGKDVADIKVENSLYHLATGYTVTDVKIDKEGNQVKVKKHIPPNLGAAIFWLKNRRPDRWRDKQDINMSNTKLSDIHINIQPVEPYIPENE